MTPLEWCRGLLEARCRLRRWRCVSDTVWAESRLCCWEKEKGDWYV